MDKKTAMCFIEELRQLCKKYDLPDNFEIAIKDHSGLRINFYRSKEYYDNLFKDHIV